MENLRRFSTFQHDNKQQYYFIFRKNSDNFFQDATTFRWNTRVY
jgi:hypothetical protein